jgi:hypothetical protein
MKLMGHTYTYTYTHTHTYIHTGVSRFNPEGYEADGSSVGKRKRNSNRVIPLEDDSTRMYARERLAAGFEQVCMYVCLCVCVYIYIYMYV